MQYHKSLKEKEQPAPEFSEAFLVFYPAMVTMTVKIIALLKYFF
jgi:hypothetical protein